MNKEEGNDELIEETLQKIKTITKEFQKNKEQYSNLTAKTEVISNTLKTSLNLINPDPKGKVEQLKNEINDFIDESKHEMATVDNAVKQKHIENIAPWNYDYVPTFVTLLAIVSFNYEGIRGLFLFTGIMLIIFAIFANTSMFYSSPLYRILGLKIYQVDDSLLGDHCILMSFDNLSDKEALFCRKIYENVYYVTKS